MNTTVFTVRAFKGEYSIFTQNILNVSPLKILTKSTTEKTKKAHEKMTKQKKNAMRNNAILNSYLTSFCVAHFRYFAWRLFFISSFRLVVFVFSTFRLALFQGEKTKKDARRKDELKSGEKQTPCEKTTKTTKCIACILCTSVFNLYLSVSSADNLLQIVWSHIRPNKRCLIT